MSVSLMAEHITPNSLGDIDGLIWYNGELVEWRQAKVHVLSHSLHYASGVFEGIRVYNGKIFQAEAHLNRLRIGARSLHMEFPFTRKQLVAACENVVAAQKIENGYIRPLVWRGTGPMDFDPKPNPPNIAIAAWHLGSFLRNGSRLTLSRYRRPAPDMGPWRTKATGLYLTGTLAKNESRSAGYDDALMRSWNGNVADTTGTNIGMVIDGEIYTPKADGFFGGLTIQTAMKLALAEGIACHTRDIPIDMLARAQEVFLTGTAAGIVPIAEIRLSAKKTLSFEHGPVTSLLIEKYTDLYMARATRPLSSLNHKTKRQAFDL